MLHLGGGGVEQAPLWGVYGVNESIWFVKIINESTREHKIQSMYGAFRDMYV